MVVYALAARWIGRLYGHHPGDVRPGRERAYNINRSKGVSSTKETRFELELLANWNKVDKVV
jgi:hypothetical protein